MKAAVVFLAFFVAVSAGPVTPSTVIDWPKADDFVDRIEMKVNEILKESRKLITKAQNLESYYSFKWMFDAHDSVQTSAESRFNQLRDHITATDLTYEMAIGMCFCMREWVTVQAVFVTDYLGSNNYAPPKDVADVKSYVAKREANLNTLTSNFFDLFKK